MLLIGKTLAHQIWWIYMDVLLSSTISKSTWLSCFYIPNDLQHLLPASASQNGHLLNSLYIVVSWGQLKHVYFVSGQTSWKLTNTSAKSNLQICPRCRVVFGEDFCWGCYNSEGSRVSSNRDKPHLATALRRNVELSLKRCVGYPRSQSDRRRKQSLVIADARWSTQPIEADHWIDPKESKQHIRIIQDSHIETSIHVWRKKCVKWPSNLVSGERPYPSISQVDIF